MKEEIESKLKSVLNGENCPLEFLKELKIISSFIEKAKEKVRMIAIEEAEKHGKTAKLYGCEFSVSSGATYSYDNSNVEYNNICDRKKKIEGMMKAATQLGEANYIEEETGEVFQAATRKESKKSIKILIK